MSVLRRCIGCLIAPAATFAQCPDPAWLPGEGMAGTDLASYAAVMWDPDGAGPQTARLVVGGIFNVAGTAVSRGLAMVDPATGEWSDIGGGVSDDADGLGDVYALAVLGTGELVVAGSFSHAGGTPASNIATWNGNSWSPLGKGIRFASVLEPVVRSLAVAKNGDLIAGGDFVMAGDSVANNIARWNGASWSALGSGLEDSEGLWPVLSVAVRPNGNVIAGGDFMTAGGQPAPKVAEWNGTKWTAPGGGVQGIVNAVALLPAGDIVAAGLVFNAGGLPVHGVARWNGSVWSAMGDGLSDWVFALHTTAAGDLFAGGQFQRSGTTVVNGIARWDGAAWAPLGTGVSDPQSSNGDGWDSMGWVSMLASTSDGDLIAGGQFQYAGSASAKDFARWDGSTWSGLAPGFTDWISALYMLPNGDVLAGGAFGAAGSSIAPLAARWDGNSWSALPEAPFVMGGYVAAFARLVNGDLVLAGEMRVSPSFDPFSFSTLMRWDGAAWTDMSNLSAELNGPTRALAALPGGGFIVAGDFTVAGGSDALRIAKWDGHTWTTLGTGLGPDGSMADALAILKNGDIVVGGYFSTAGGAPASNIARWNGAQWAPLGSGMDGQVMALAVAPDGGLIAVGLFSTAGGVASNGVARWDGKDWSALGAGLQGGAYAVIVRPDGEVIVGGEFSLAGGVQAANIAQWNGSSWSALGLGITEGDGGTSIVDALALRPSGELVAGGRFFKAGGRTSVNFARFGCDQPDCYADLNQDGVLDLFDFLAFVNAFNAGDPSADCAADGAFDLFDFLCFVNAFNAGC